MEYAVTHPNDTSLNDAWRAIHMVFSWVDQFNQRPWAEFWAVDVESFPQRNRRFLYEFSTNPHDSFVSWGLFERTWCKLLGQNCPVLMNPGYDAQNHKGNPRFDEFMKQVPPPWLSTGLRTVGTMCESQKNPEEPRFWSWAFGNFWQGVVANVQCYPFVATTDSAHSSFQHSSN